MRTITTTKFADTVRQPKIRFTFENDRPMFYVANNPGPTLEHASDRFVDYDCSNYSNGLLEILVAYGTGAYSDVVYYRYTPLANMVDPAAITWGTWSHFHSNAAVYSAKLYNARLYLGRANATTTTAAMDYTNFGGATFGTANVLTTDIGKGNISVAPLDDTNRLIVCKKSLINSVYTNTYVLAGLDTTCELGYPNVGSGIGNMQAIQVGTDIYVYYNELDDEGLNKRVLYYKNTQADGVGQSFNGWSGMKYVIPMDVLDDLSMFTMGGLTVLNNQVFVSGILKRANGPLMHVYTIGPEKFTMGRNMFIAAVNPGDDPGKLIRVGDYIFYLANGLCYWTDLTRLMAGSSSTFVTDEIISAQMQQAVNSPASLNASVVHNLDDQSDEIVAGADMDVALDFGDGFETIGRFNVDGILNTRDGSSRSTTFSTRSAAMKNLAAWESDAPYDYWSQAKMNCNPKDLTKVIRLTGLWAENNNDLYPTRMNEDGFLYVAERSCRNGMVSARFKKSVAYTSTSYPKFGVGLGFSVESKYTAAVRLGRDTDEVEDDELLRNGMVAYYRGDTERLYLMWIKDNVQWNCNWTGGTADGAASYVSLALTTGHKYWLKMTLHEGVVNVLYRDDTSPTWISLISAKPSCDIGAGQVQVDIPTPETGARGVLYMRNCTPYSTLAHECATTDKILCALDTSAFPATGEVLISDERMAYCAKVGSANLRARAKLSSVNPAESARANDTTNGNYTVLNFGNDDTTYRIKRVLTWSGGGTYPNSILTVLPIGKVGNPGGLRIKVYNGSNVLQETIVVDGSAIASVGTYNSDRLFPGLAFTYTPKTFATTWYFIIEPAAGVSDAANYFKYLGYTPVVASTYKGTKTSTYTQSTGEIIYVQSRASIGATPTSFAVLGADVSLASAIVGGTVFVENDAFAGKFFVIKSAATNGSYTVITMTEAIGNYGYLVNNIASNNLLWPNCDGAQLIELPYIDVAAKLDLNNRGVGATSVTTHSLGDTVHLYTTLPLATVDSLSYFSDEVDLCLKDMVEEIARKAGVLSVTSRILAPVNGLYPGRNFVVDFAARTYANAANHIVIDARKRDAVYSEMLLNPGFETAGSGTSPNIVTNPGFETLGNYGSELASNPGFETINSLTNLVPNPGFETAGGGGADVFSSWEEAVVSGGVVSRDVGVYHSGAASCKLTASASVGSYARVRTPIMTTGREDWHRLTFWARGDGTNAGQIQIKETIYGTDVLPLQSTYAVSTTWAQKTVEFYTSHDDYSLQLYLFSPSAVNSYCYFDDIVLEDVASLFDGWYAYAKTPEVDTGIYHGGSRSLKLTRPAELSHGLDYDNPNLTAVAGHTYRLTFWMRGDGTGTHIPKLDYKTIDYPLGGWSQSNITPDGTNWKQYTYDLYATTSGRIDLTLSTQFSPTGTVCWFDDISIHDITDLVSNWTEYVGKYQNAVQLVVDGDGSKTASNSIYLSNRDNTAQPYVYQDMTVTPGATYRVAFWYRDADISNAPRFSIYDQTNGADIIALTSLSIGTAWKKYLGTFVAPSGCTVARLFLYAGGSGWCRCYFDDFVIMDPNQAGAWDLTQGDGYAVRTTTAGEFRSGAAALKITNGASKNTLAAQLFEVLPGQAYNLSFWVRGDAGAGHAGRYKVLDATNNIDIVALTDSAITGTTFVNIVTAFVAPVDCDSVSVIFYGNDLTTGSVFVDDVSITEPSVILNIEDDKISYVSGAVIREEVPLTARLQGALRISFYEEYMSVWCNERLVAGFVISVTDQSCLGTYCAISGGTPLFYEPHRRIDNFILDNGRKADELINSLIGEKRFYFMDDTSGGLQLFQSRTPINTYVTPYLLAVEAGNMQSDTLSPTRVRVEGAEVYETIDMNALRTYGNIFRTKNMNEVNSLRDAQTSAAVILEDLSHRYKMHTLAGALDPRVEPLDEIYYSDGDDIIRVIVDGVSYAINVSSEPVFDMRLECREF